MESPRPGLRCLDPLGPFWTPKNDKETIRRALKQYPDLEYDGRMLHIVPDNFLPISELKIPGDICVIAGSGPSLDCFEDVGVPIFSCNYATEYLAQVADSTIYHIQLDAFSVDIGKAIPILTRSTSKYYKKSPLGYFYTARELGVPVFNSGVQCINIAKYLGFKKMLLVGLDGIFEGGAEYAGCVSCRQKDKREWYVKHKQQVIKILDGVDYHRLEGKEASFRDAFVKLRGCDAVADCGVSVGIDDAEDLASVPEADPTEW